VKKGQSGDGPHAPRPYNPLEKRRLAESIVRELLESEPQLLPPAEQFLGAGIYLVYYTGGFTHYRRLAELNRDDLAHPIYVGRAVSPGGRVGGFSEDSTPAAALFKRLNEHAASIRQVSSLSLDDFRCRYLVVDEFWISLAESLLIESYRPLWNVVISGFGNHHVGTARIGGKRTLWDSLHPGRSWAENQTNPNIPLVEIEERIRAHLLELPTSQR
jgi:hypothetical protein